MSNSINSIPIEVVNKSTPSDHSINRREFLRNSLYSATFLSFMGSTLLSKEAQANPLAVAGFAVALASFAL